MSAHDKHIWGRWSAGTKSYGAGEHEVVLGAIVDDNEDAPELRAVGRWMPARGMAPELGLLMDRAIRMPVEGRPHLPRVVRVPAAGMGEDIQGVRPETRCEIGPTPFLDSELDRLAKELESDERWVWLEGDVTPEMVNKLFDVGRAFVEHPWDLEDPTQVIRLVIAGRDAPCGALVDATLSATGGDVVTVAIAPTPEAIGDWKDDVVPADGIEVWFYERDDLPDAAWAEVGAHGFDPGERDLYPRVVAGGDLTRAATAAELALAVDVLDAVGRFYRDGAAVPTTFGGASSATLVLTSGVSATVSVDPEELIEPAEDDDEDDDELDELERESEEDEAFLTLDDENPWPAAPPPASATVRVAAKPGRNDPCWCGSGTKYKKCHLDEDAAKARV